MKIAFTHRNTAIIGLGSAVGLLFGSLFSDFYLAAASSLGLCFAGLRTAAWSRRASQAAEKPKGAAKKSAGPPPRKKRSRPTTVDPGDTYGLAEQMLAQGRYGLLMRPQIARGLPADQLEKAAAALDEAMALVPEGDVFMCQDDDDADTGNGATAHGATIPVGPFLLDRYPVTNRQYQQFVMAGGYEQMALWDREIWPAVLEFVDGTGEPGPRDWENGDYEAGKEDHPVVGISWFEAAAFARWVGKRLPTDPEWVKAGCWPVPVTGGAPLQRRYPWGDAMDRRCANLWGSGPGRTTPVTEFADGASVGGVFQLIGNVWEWTTGDYGAWHAPDHRFESPVPLKSVRGGAFDTYFDNQASCHFQSGDNPIARKHNIGFRCALGTCDVAQGGTLDRGGSASPGMPAADEGEAEP